MNQASQVHWKEAFSQNTPYLSSTCLTVKTRSVMVMPILGMVYIMTAQPLNFLIEVAAQRMLQREVKDTLMTWKDTSQYIKVMITRSVFQGTRTHGCLKRITEYPLWKPHFSTPLPRRVRFWLRGSQQSCPLRMPMMWPPAAEKQIGAATVMPPPSAMRSSRSEPSCKRAAVLQPWHVMQRMRKQKSGDPQRLLHLVVSPSPTPTRTTWKKRKPGSSRLPPSKDETLSLWRCRQLKPPMDALEDVSVSPLPRGLTHSQSLTR